MHVEEIAFHLAVPFVVLAITAAMGYYVVVLFTNLLKMA
jgi:uncharacterized protein (UPF0333 family)